MVSTMDIQPARTDSVGMYAQYWRVELVSTMDIQPARTDPVGMYAQYKRVELVSTGIFSLLGQIQ